LLPCAICWSISRDGTCSAATEIRGLGDISNDERRIGLMAGLGSPVAVSSVIATAVVALLLYLWVVADLEMVRG
jgi:hypothetical protein